MGTVILGIGFGVIGLVLIAVLLRALLSGLIGDPRSWRENFRFRQREKTLKEADAALASQPVSAASLKLLRESFFLDHIQSDLNLIEKVNAHHMGILERILGIADQYSKHIPNLAIVEDLVQSRCELMRSYKEALMGRQNMVRNRKSKKSVPAWALDEYKRKIEEILDRLKTNRRSLDSQLSEVFVVLLKDDSPSEITYH